jgi:hypothetical protein
LGLFDETEVETQQEKSEVDNGAKAADPRRNNKVCSQERYRNFRGVQVELRPRAHKERACQKLAELTASISKIERRQSDNDECCQQKWYHGLSPKLSSAEKEFDSQTVNLQQQPRTLGS